ncbi:MAG TPA: polyphosphate:AMP phosphotransferase [Burkholderiaceae bacterium]
MFESAEIGHKVGKKKFKEAVPPLRSALLDAQFELNAQKKFPVIVLVSGQDGAGKGETINLLYEWMDPRYLTTLAFEHPTDEERERPVMWRFWRNLPPKGRIGLLSGSWYSEPIHRRITGEMSLSRLDARIDQINRFEAMLVNEGALVLKFWLHLTKPAQEARFKRLEANPRTAWRVTPEHWASLKTYDQLQDVAGHVLRMTNTTWAPWTVVEAADDNYRSLTVGQTLLEAMRIKLASLGAETAPPAPAVAVRVDARNVLTELDMGQELGEEEYADQLAFWQGRLSELVRDARFAHRSLVCAFEGVDAAGKGGSIRRVAKAFDARQFQIVPIAAPTDEESARPYLWRFWRHIPRRGKVSIFDRTWYGRVLVERVEKLCSEADWLRAYGEINDFEHDLAEAGAIVVKFWLQISKAEQMARFKKRENVEFKRFKITDEDWRNRRKWSKYERAVCDMIDRTSTGTVAWTLVEANDKRFARVKILRTICERVEAELNKQVEGEVKTKAVARKKPAAAKRRA